MTPGREHEPVGVQLLARPACAGAEFRDHPALDRKITHLARHPGAIDQERVPDDQIVHILPEPD